MFVTGEWSPLVKFSAVWRPMVTNLYLKGNKQQVYLSSRLCANYAIIPYFAENQQMPTPHNIL
jgi:hypothetical protein